MRGASRSAGPVEFSPTASRRGHPSRGVNPEWRSTRRRKPSPRNRSRHENGPPEASLARDTAARSRHAVWGEPTVDVGARQFYVASLVGRYLFVVHAPGTPCAGCDEERRLGRRRFVGLLSAGVALVLAGCGRGSRRAAAHHTTTLPPVAGPSPILPDGDAGPPLTLGAIPPARSGHPVVYSSAPQTAGNLIALTIDDGYCGDCIAKYVAFAQSTGIHITFNPNGVFGRLWTPLVDIVRPLVADRQVQFGNHTWDHANLLTRGTRRSATSCNATTSGFKPRSGSRPGPGFVPPTATTTPVSKKWRRLSGSRTS